jgi:amino acid adenylation domain-containing protein
MTESVPSAGSGAAGGSIPARFAEVVSRHGDRVAVCADDGSWTYAQLDGSSDAVAGRILDRLGAGNGPVALLYAPGAPLIAAILGVLKSGRMYLTLDPEDSVARLQTVVREATIELLLTDPGHAALGCQVCSGEALALDPSTLGDTSTGVRQQVLAEAGAWLLFTSGSTGVPKGVLQSHAGVVHHTEVYAEMIQLTADDRLSLLTSLGLAASSTHLFAALLNGATLCPFDIRSQGVERAASWLIARRITAYHSVPTLFRHVWRKLPLNRRLDPLRIVRLGGEPMLPSDLELFRAHCTPECQLIHGLSSTETGLICAHWLDHHAPAATTRVPVGRPVRGAEVFLVDEDGRQVGPGGEGRIAVRGVGLARGYWRQPDLTARDFRADPARPGDRVFVMGDFGRFDDRGCLEHLGRVDQCVKIRGQRVDLLLVESALRGLGDVVEAAVIASVDQSGEARLAAFVVPRSDAGGSARSCRQRLRAALPASMVPDWIMPLPKLPLTAGRKVDRHALHQLPLTSTRPARHRPMPRDGIEKRLAVIWETTLGLEAIGRKEHFFELGGTSIDSVQVLVRIEDEFNLSLPPATLAEHATLERLAEVVALRAVSRAPSPLVPLRPAHAGRPLFLVHGGKGDITMYGQLARRLSDRPVYAFQAVGLNGEGWPLRSIPAMARRYVAEMETVDPSGPHLLAGTCMGGLIAFEMGQQLVRAGRRVGFLALLDSDFPARTGHRLRVTERVVEPVRDLVRITRWLVFRGLGLGRNPRWLPAYRRFVHNVNARARRAYRPSVYPGTIHLLLAEDAHHRGEDLRLAMRHYARETVVATIPGSRAELFLPPTVDAVARQLSLMLPPS